MRNFNPNRVEFNVCYGIGEDEEYFQIPVDRSVQNALKEMLSKTIEELYSEGDVFADYEPSERYEPIHRLKADLEHSTMERLRNVFNAQNIDTCSGSIDVDRLSYYFCVFRDSHDRKLIAFKRAIQFKGVVKKRLITIVDDTLKMVDDNVFKLDADFDFLVFGKKIYILRPSSFVYIASLTAQIMEKAAEYVSQLSESVGFLDTSDLGEYVSTHSRAARMVVTIQSRDDLSNLNRRKLTTHCEKFGVSLISKDGKIKPEKGSEMDFLKLLDRRLYSVNLNTGDGEEHFEAAGRKSR